ncbi:DUF228 domain-containing protein [Borrelia miyamotoi]|uniref:DUF228 domain-containing protein n=1 Tax=Borrelia miyamotoi TaxID=47466 RepID=A0AAQ2WYM0_9SPIR|nr:DUF228 domain-containing protein [Borrelia miyamotoi]QTL84225.1 DUF228 domain-containing protein [Borrelia miyamotoi]QTL84305.1 DUF228 domain-containing protein [Borrelia miyamotoi]WAZ85873.1 DUF228 domain-containing protein [Borrelia miyamotoi]WAZ85974.1 DUF228 domain-containing protein [Borrelia miyamotoi]WAZ91617.1 DUF228 domain-containing protein [Borrelia miyamotoi]
MLRSKEQQTPSLRPNESLDPEMYASMDDTEIVESLKQQLEQESHIHTSGGKRRGKRHAPVLETTEGKTLKDYILKLKKYSKSFNYDRAVFKPQADFRDKNITFDAISQAVSSSTDKIEEYTAIGFPYKRAVKLKVETTKPDSISVEVSDGKNMYGICIDIDEYRNVATVMPITNNFQGYLVAASSSGINVGDKLDFDSYGRVIKASSYSQVSINAIALSSIYTLQLTDDESKKEQEDYKLHLIKISLYGNKAVS